MAFFRFSPFRRSLPRRRAAPPPRLEQLEDRLAPAIITVTTTADDITPNDGSVSLREAITAINAGNTLGDPDIIAQGTFGTNDAIRFHIVVVQPLLGGGPPFVGIDVGSDASAPHQPLPAITKPVAIDATTQIGFSGAPLIIVNGLDAAAGANGFVIQLGTQTASYGVTIKGFVINQFSGNGIVIDADNIAGSATTASTITGNYIGTNESGTAAQRGMAALGNGNGILIDATNSNNLGLAASKNIINNNIISGNDNDGVLIQAHNGVAAGNTLTGNFIGTGFGEYQIGNFIYLNVAGVAAIPNSRDGVAIDGASGNKISPGNIISANGADGIHIIGTVANPATANVLADNFIGVDVYKNTPLGHQHSGIEISGANRNNIAGNVVGGNANGIELDNGSQSNLIQGNLIGVGVNGSSPVGNEQHGIVLHSDNSGAGEPAVVNNLIGGLGQGDGNTIAFNGTGGIAVFGNPVSGSGQANTGNTIEGNSIFQNGRSNPASLLGIDLSNQFPYPADDGVTTNDSGGHGAANDPNNFQNFPVLTSVTPAGSGTEIQGTLTEAAASNTAFRVEFFASKADPLNGLAEGQFFVGFVKVTTNASGNAAFDVTLPAKLAPGLVLTATATDPAGNTSEFSAAVAAPTANQFLVDKVYHDLLGRVADPGGLAAWTALLNNGVSPARVVFLIETDAGHEYYARLVSSFYQFYLHRPEEPSDGAAPANMVNLLAGGGAIEQLRTVFTSSPEYFQTRGGGTNPGYVNALYLDAFGTPNRVATDPGAAAFANALPNGSVTRVQVSNVVFTSDEFRFDLVQSYYVQFLHRSGAAGEINGWAALLKQGVPDQPVIAGILGSPEAFALAMAAP